MQKIVSKLVGAIHKKLIASSLFCGIVIYIKRKGETKLNLLSFDDSFAVCPR